MQCWKKNVPDLPLMDMVVDHCLNISNYQLQPQHCRALYAVFEQCKNKLHSINSVNFENNALLDDDLSNAVEGLVHVDNIHKFSCKSNSIGPKSMEHLITMIQRPPPNQLRELYLSNCNLGTDTFHKLLEALAEKSQLTSLTLQGEEIYETTRDKLIDYLYYSKRLVKFELSFCKMALACFNKIVE